MLQHLIALNKSRTNIINTMESIKQLCKAQGFARDYTVWNNWLDLRHSEFTSIEVFCDAWIRHSTWLLRLYNLPSALAYP
jgi:L-asparagine transporter-like permease